MKNVGSRRGGNKIMTARELAKLLMKTPDREVYAIDYTAIDNVDLIALDEVYQEEDDDKVVLSFC